MIIRLAGNSSSLFEKNDPLVLFIRLYQVPKVAIQVFKHGYHPVVFLFWRPDEMNVFFCHIVIVPPKVVGKQEKEYAASGLVANGLQLAFICGFG